MLILVFLLLAWMQVTNLVWGGGGLQPHISPGTPYHWLVFSSHWPLNDLKLCPLSLSRGMSILDSTQPTVTLCNILFCFSQASPRV